MFAYKTKNNGTPQGKPKVYFSCHHDDFEDFFELITNELFSKQSCAVWYHTDMTAMYDEMELEDLADMALIVMPVTSRMLTTPNRAMDVDFPFAIQHRIPVLPLMMEPNLEQLYAQRFGQLQFLSRFNENETTIGYEEKLTKYLEAVLVGDELAARIREAFGVYLFLSYRKKDRREARRLMQQIHQYGFCRDVAIWYDEYLTPGEDFNEMIEDMLVRSPVFGLVVTPNLVNEANYVQSIEYPMAKQHQKPIFSVQMLPTDRRQLEEQYLNIPPCVDAADAKQFEMTLHTLFDEYVTPMLGLSDDPEHEYLMGMAYLNGVDVEVNRERALALIVSAANQDYEPATEQLIYMYDNGDGVPFDTEESLRWKKRLVEQTRAARRRDNSSERSLRLLRAEFELGNAYYIMNRYEEAAEELKGLALSCLIGQMPFGEAPEHDQRTIMEMERYHALATGVLGDIMLETGDYERAMEHYSSALSMSRALLDKWDSGWLRRDYAVALRGIAKIHKIQYRFDEAIECLEEALQCHRNTLKLYDDRQFSFDVAMTLNMLSELYRLKGDSIAAIRCSKQAIEWLDEQIRLYGERPYIGWKMTFLMSLEEGYRLGGKLDEARLILDSLDPLLERSKEVFGQPAWHILYLCDVKHSQISFMEQNYEEGILYGERAVRMHEEHNVVNRTGVQTGDTTLVGAYSILGICYLNGRMDLFNAKRCFGESIRLAQDLVDSGVDFGMADLCLNMLQYAQCLEQAGELDEAWKILQQAEELYDRLPDEDRFRKLLAGFMLGFGYGRVLLRKEESEKALACFLEAERYLEEFGQSFSGSASLMESDKQALLFNIAIAETQLDASAAKERFQQLIDRLEAVPTDTRTPAEWEYLTTSYLFMTMLVGLFKRRLWNKKYREALANTQALLGDAFYNTGLYELLKENGLW